MSLIEPRKGTISTFPLHLLILYTVLTVFPVGSLAADTYRFERMWPTLQQPWYFLEPSGIAIDVAGYIYVVDSNNHTIDKFTSDGKFITSWGGTGSGDGQLGEPEDIAIDASGQIYVTDYKNHRIQKFTPDGRFIAKWGTVGAGTAEFRFPTGIAIGPNGNIYVADKLNHRVQKFSADGKFITMWGGQGDGEGQFDRPGHIAIDQSGDVFVVDSKNSRIQKFSQDGGYISAWGSHGSDDGEFIEPWGIAIDASNIIYVLDMGSSRIQQFTTDGSHIYTYIANWNSVDHRLNTPKGLAVGEHGNIYIADTHGNRIQKLAPDWRLLINWESQGKGDGQFHGPGGLAVDANGDIYVAEVDTSRIQKFSPDGRFMDSWGEWGGSPGQLLCPAGVVTDSNNDLFVVETCGSRIQKFTPDGNPLMMWGGEGIENGKLNGPEGIAIGPNGFLYVADTDNHRIQVFSAQGDFITKWGEAGIGAGRFDNPVGIAVDGSGFVYVADTGNCRIQKFSSNGQYVNQWGQLGSQDGQFRYPAGVWIDTDNHIYVADTENGRIQVFTDEGDFVAKWGSQGGSPGQMSRPIAGAIGGTGQIYVSESTNNRIQAFSKTALVSQAKAIIVAGGGPFAGNNLWNATQMCANFAYRTLLHQGFTKDTIFYLTADTDLDLDNNGQSDDVDGDLKNDNLQQAIITWASDADSLIIYLADHGGKNTFRMSATETLPASELDRWLDQLQAANDGQVVVIYDACESGSFLSSLAPPVGTERVLITSTSLDESAYFVSQGSVSFSSYFWTQIFNGYDINAAFDLTREAVQYATSDQHPLLDANGNGVGNETEDYTLSSKWYIGNGTVVQSDLPEVGDVSPHQTIQATTSARLSAVIVDDNNPIARVWATIRPPDYRQDASGKPVQGLPTIDFKPIGGNQYDATYDGFNTSGTYHIAIYARDKKGSTSIPQLTTVAVDNPLRRRAIIVAGGDLTDTLWPAIQNCARFAYEALTFQGYSDADIYYLNPNQASGSVDAAPSMTALSTAITTWALSRTQDLTVYLVGTGGHKHFRLNAIETLSATDLDGWIDRLQNEIPGIVTVVYDADRSGSFLASMAPQNAQKRILIASTGEDGSAHFPLDGTISFSAFFWRQVLDGARIRDAFVHSINSVGYALQGQQPMLDDSGNGLGNEQGIDGRLASDYWIGSGIMLAGDAPIIGSISAPRVLAGERSVEILAQDVTSTRRIDKVYAIILPPGFSTGDPSHFLKTSVTLELKAVGDNDYQATYDGVGAIGIYQVSIYAVDENGNVSLPEEMQVDQTIGPDVYEVDDTFSQANVIVLSGMLPQTHNFHDAGDQDWYKFYGVKGEPYEIDVRNVGINCDVIINVFDTSGSTLLDQRNWGFEGEDELLTWVAPKNGIYHVMIQHVGTTVAGFGPHTSYTIAIYRPDGLLTGLVSGRVIDSVSGLPIQGAMIVTDGGGSAISLPDGSFLMIHLPGDFTFTIDDAGHEPVSYSGISVKEGVRVNHDFKLAGAPAKPVNPGVSQDSGGGGGGGCFIDLLVVD